MQIRNYRSTDEDAVIRLWPYYLAVAANHRKQSHGRALMKEAEQRLIARGCPKINLMVRSSNAAVIDFYRSLGYAPEDVISMGAGQ